jgi:hypothetical protein
MAPEGKRNGPGVASEPASENYNGAPILPVEDSSAQRRRRREAAKRMPRLADGRRDPHDPPGRVYW